MVKRDGFARSIRRPTGHDSRQDSCPVHDESEQPIMQRIVIVGLGLIGGSVGLTLRRWAEERRGEGGKPLEVIGFDANLDQQRAAEKLGAVDRGAWELAKAAREADVVVLATPVNGMREV